MGVYAVPVSKLPTYDSPKMKCINENGEVFYILRDMSKSKKQFILYKEIKSGYDRLGTAELPSDFDKDIFS